MTYALPELNVPSNYESYLVVEKYSGASFLLEEQIMICAELKPDILYPNLGLKTLQSTGYRTYMPSFFEYKDFSYTDAQLQENFGQIKTVLAIHLWIQVIGYTLGGVLLLGTAFVYLLWYCRRRRQRKMKAWKSPSDSSSTIRFLNHQRGATQTSEELLEATA